MRSTSTVLSGAICLFLFTCCALATAEEYRIDSQARFNALCEAVFAPRDVVLFKKGVVFEGMFAPSGSGAEGDPIVIKAYGEGKRPIINAKGKQPAGLLLKNVSFWEVEGLEITNTDGTDADQGTLFGIYVLAERTEETQRHIHINDCYIHDVNGKVEGKKRGGIHVHMLESNSAVFDDLRITNNRIERVGGVGIGNSSSCGDIEFLKAREVEHNLWTNVYVAGNFVGETGRNGIIARVSKDAVYEYNVLAKNSRYSTGHSIFCFDTSGIKIQYNEAYGNTGPGGIDRGGFDADYNCTRTFIQYNYSHDNNWFCGIMKRPNRHVVIRYNVSQNDKEGIYFYGFEKERKAEDIHIYNNTHFVRAGLHVDVFPEGRTPINTRFENNVFFFEGKGEWGENAAGINTEFHNNLYFNIPPHISDQRPICANPMFTHPDATGTNIDLKTMRGLEGYRPLPGSPCLNSGVVIEAAGGRDLMGVKIPVGTPFVGALGGK